jgi:hypothetical protein
MTIETIPARVAVLFAFNSPIVVGLGSIFFTSWSDFFESFIPGFDFGFWSWILERHTYPRFENYKLYLFFILIAALLYGEYRLIWPSPPTSKPEISISRLVIEHPNPPLKSDPACIAFRSVSTFRYLGSAHRPGAGAAA